MRPTASELNQHLESGGVVQVTTYLRSTVYDQKHAGWFRELTDGALAVRHGRTFNRLSMGDKLLVAIRKGREVTL